MDFNGLATSLDVCYAYKVLFAIRRSGTTNCAMLHSDQKRPIQFRIGLFWLLIAGLEFVVGATLMLCETQSTLGSGVSEEEQSKRLF